MARRSPGVVACWAALCGALLASSAARAADPAPAPPAPAAAAPAASPAAPAVAPAPAAAPAPADKAPDSAAFVYPTPGVGNGGGVGFGRFVFADAGRAGSLRLNLNASLFQLNNFPTVGTDRSIVGALSAGYTILSGLEVFGAYENSSNYNSATVPSLVQAQGDVLVGIKYGGLLGPVRLAGDVRIDFKNGVGQDYIASNSIDGQLRLLAGMTFGALSLDLNGGFIVGRDTQMIQPSVNGQYSALLLGSGLSGYSQFVAGLVLRYKLPIFTPTVGIDFDVPIGVAASDLTADNTTLGNASTKRLTIGGRFIAGEVSAFDIAFEIGFGSGVAGFARTEPWALIAGYSFAFDPGLYRPLPPAPPAPPPAPPKDITVALHGYVLDAQTGLAIPGAVIEPAGGLPVAAGTDGAFVTRDMKAGETTFRFEREGYRPAEVKVAVNSDTPPAVVRLDPLPPPVVAPQVVAPPPTPVAPPMGFLAGTLVGPDGGLAADVKVSGTTSQETRSGADGSFSVRLPAGEYSVLVVADGFYARTASVTVATDQATAILLKTLPKPAKSSVTFDGEKITFAKPYVLDEKRVTPTQPQLDALAEVADLLVRNPTKKLVVNVHSDLPKKAQGDRLDWTEERAQGIRNALIGAGAPADRVDAHGLGTTQPLVPSTSKAASQNRRVELQMTELPAHKIVPIVPMIPAGGETVPAPKPNSDVPDLPPLN